MKKIFPILFCCITQALFGQWSGSTTTAGSINRQGKVILNSPNWDDHLEISRTGFGGVFKPDGSGGYQGLRLDLIGTGSNFYVLNGNIGVGVTQPTENIHVSGNIRLSGSSRKVVVGTEGSPSDYLLLQDAGSGTAAFQWVQDGLGKFTIEGTTGNVGIGIPGLPTDKLHIDGDIRLRGSSRKIIVGTESNISDYLLLQDVGSGTAAFQWVQDGSTKFTIEGTTGNVGIGTGTTIPDAKLAVKGQVHAQEVKVDLNVPGPDYVFEKDYQLTSLEEIKNFIDQNKHLPEVPSAKEMEKNGVQLGEMNMLLLKKIEELTLYVIEQNKRIDNQQIEIKELKNILHK